MKPFHRASLLALATAALAGCEAFPTAKGQDPEAIEQTAKVDIHAPFPVMHRGAIEDIKLVEMLAGEEEGRRIAMLPTDAEDRVKGMSWSTKYDLAFATFYRRLAGDVESQKVQRNRVQERILMASDQRCSVFKTNLQRDQSRNSFWFGALGTFAGALGAVSSGAQAAKNLAAVSGVLSGVRAEYNQAFYSNLLFAVITRGIEERRREAYRMIQQEGQTKAITAYPVEAAVKDAILYDGLCNTAAGLEQAQESIRLAQDPGQDTLNRLLVKANLTRSILENKTTDLSSLAKSGTDPNAGQLVVKASRTDFGSHLGGMDNISVTAIDVVAQAEKSKLSKRIDEAPAMLKYPEAFSEADRKKVVAKVTSEIKSVRDDLFDRLNICVQTDGADAVKGLIVARSVRESAATDQAKTAGERDLMGAQVKLQLVAFTMRKLAERFAKGLEAYGKEMNTRLSATGASADKVDPVVSSLKAAGSGSWDFAPKTVCGTG